jgi:hypothetical protein
MARSTVRGSAKGRSAELVQRASVACREKARHKSAYQGRAPCKSMSTNFRAFAGQSSALPAVERP